VAPPSDKFKVANPLTAWISCRRETVKFIRQRYQSGSLFKEKRRSGPAVWVFRWREDRPEGRVNRKVMLGTVDQIPTRSAALRAAEPLRANAAAGNPAVPVTVRQLVKHYSDNELPTKAHSTQRTVQTCLNVWVLPTWGEYRLSEVRTVEVEGWLRGLLLANATRAKIRNVMHTVFAHACRYEWLNRNAISLVRQSAKRAKTPDILDAEELKNLLAKLRNPARTLVFLTAGTGLRISEALALKWSDIDFRSGLINLKCAVVHQQIGDMKTEASQKPVPMGGELAGALQEWRAQTAYHQHEDWVFASPKMDGKQPYWPETLLRCYVKPAATHLGIAKQIGWHSFRRTFATLLKGSGEDVKTVQELMRHANSRLTLDVYAQALTPAKRAAHLKIVEMIRPAQAKEVLVVPSCSHTDQVSICK
jgi:integrase